MVIDDPLRVYCVSSGERRGGGLSERRSVRRQGRLPLHTYPVGPLHRPPPFATWRHRLVWHRLLHAHVHTGNALVQQTLPRYQDSSSDRPLLFPSLFSSASANSISDQSSLLSCCCLEPQGYYDPFCADLPQAPGNEGCYRCANGGNCTAVRPPFSQIAKSRAIHLFPTFFDSHVVSFASPRFI